MRYRVESGRKGGPELIFRAETVDEQGKREVTLED